MNIINMNTDILHLSQKEVNYSRMNTDVSSPLVAKAEGHTFFGIAAKPGVTRWNILSIFFL
jgi:hypothetical protein